MKTLKNLLAAFACVLLLSSTTFAQFPEELTNWSIGLRLGPAFSHTTLGGGMGFSAEGYLERKFADIFSLQGTMAMGSINNGQGVDIKDKLTSKKAAYLNFKTSTFEMLLHGKYYIQRGTVSPFISLGLGMLFYSAEIDPNGDGTYITQGGWDGDPKSEEGSGVYNEGIPIGTIETPIGAGFNYAINDMLDISVSYTFRFTSTGHFDAAEQYSVNSATAYSGLTSTTQEGFTMLEYSEIQKERIAKAGSGNDNLSLFNIGIAYKFFNPPTDEEKKDDMKKKEDE